MTSKPPHLVATFFLLALLQAGAAAAQGAQAGGRIPRTTEFKPLLFAAIDAPSGTAQAWLEGPVADRLRIQTKASPKSPVLVSVSTVKIIRTGCKRLRVTLSMPEHKMETVKHTTEPFVMWYELNLCRNGQPPEVTEAGDGESAGDGQP
jgi:hypothetical protein